MRTVSSWFRGPRTVCLVTLALIPPAGAATHYDGTLDLSIPEERIEASWRIETTVEEGTESLDLLLSSRQEVLRVEGERVRGYQVAEKEDAPFQTITVTLAEAPEPDDEIFLYLVHRGPLFDDQDPGAINRVAEDWIELGLDSFWHPVFATFDRPFTARLTLELPDDWVVVASGETHRVGNLVVLDNRVPQVDLAFVASPDLRPTKLGESVVYGTDPGSEEVRRILETAEVCAESLDRDFGREKTLPPRRFVMAPRDESGYARKNYIVLSRVSEKPAAATSFLCHELAHFWAMRGHPMTVENWLNESFAEYAGLRVVRERFGEEAFREILEEKRDRSAEAPPVWTPGSRARGPHATLYLKGPVALADLEEAIGREAFDRFFERYMTGTLDTTPELLELLEETAGEEARETFVRLLAR